MFVTLPQLHLLLSLKEPSKVISEILEILLCPTKFWQFGGGEGKWEAIDEDMFIDAAILKNMASITTFNSIQKFQLYLTAWV